MTSSWLSSTRRQELPPNWEEIRQEVLNDADGVCEIRWPGCLGWATDVDHIQRGNDHSRRNLRAACKSCHGKKSSAEGNARKRELRARRKRPQDRHPGSL
ncbi:HNH endonuclease [Mycobacterium phage SydNat]|nr:HNH endonuclease [Mycobacterium phage SydNat]UVK64393.1 HNH endonuclease [Mycobacterium phage Ghoulboy]